MKLETSLIGFENSFIVRELQLRRAKRKAQRTLSVLKEVAGWAIC